MTRLLEAARAEARNPGKDWQRVLGKHMLREAQAAGIAKKPGAFLDDSRQRPSVDMKQAVFDALARLGTATQQEVSREVPCSDSGAGRTLRVLLKAGKVERERHVDGRRQYYEYRAKT